ncbi:DUF4136 domain-containing protein [Parasphingorhabdus halotolerans]|uniref:DUF4136 domain-containing protein n=1 Tax=Parasphingorhabdus halotolerans TaxID=2725558 RepID=A0A6H2DM33_9SPHN|nr:DUF4136 domain-containing protein [Parasphingorhabdus halotolerans]QJB69440.1 DUF4136 domain-containing protein [Parasphingorhabdus halotolerans]
MTGSSKTISRRGLMALAPFSLLALSACATPFRADVQRFVALPETTGQSFAVVASDPELKGGLEFAQYAGLVEQRMIELGYQRSDDPAAAQLIVSMDYDVDKGREKVVADYDPFYSNIGFGSYYGRGFGRRGFYGSHRYRYGFHDPFLFGGYGFSGYGGARSFTVFTTELDMKIDRAVDGERLFEGKAEAMSRSKNLTYLVPNLVEAMFTGFPGNSGEKVRISVAPEKN